MNSLPFVSVIVTNYNGRHFLDSCFRSLYKINYPRELYEVIMVDNGSTDGSVEFVEKSFPWVKIIRLDKNFGFTGGNNRGVKKAKGDFLVFLNNDTEVDENWLIELVKAATKLKNVGICGSKILFMRRNVVHFENGYLTLVGGGVFPSMGKKDCKEKTAPFPTACIHGASFLIKRDVFKEIGGFDEDYFLYGDEADICLRTWLYGYSVLSVPTSIVYHAFMGGKAVKEEEFKKVMNKPIALARLGSLVRAFHGNKNSIATIIKNYDGIHFLEGIVLVLLFGLLQLFMLLKSRSYSKEIKASYIKCLFLAYIWPLKHMKTLLRKRYIIRRKRKRSIGYLVKSGFFFPLRDMIKLAFKRPYENFPSELKKETS